MSDSITIPGGNNTTVTLNVPGMFSQAIVGEFAAAMVSAANAGTLVVNEVGADGSVPTLPAGSTGLLTLGGATPAQITVPAGYGFVADTIAAAVTVSSGSTAPVTILAQYGHLTYMAGTGGGTVVAAAGDNVFLGSDSAGSSYTISYSSGNNTVWAAAAEVVVTAGTGANFIGLGSGGGLVVSDGSDTVASNTGAATVMNQAADALTFGSIDNDLLVNQAAANTVVAGSGSDTMFGAEIASVAGSTYFLASSVTSASVMVESDVSDTIVAGIGHATIWGGAGNDDIYSAGGNLVFMAGAGSTSLTGAANSQIVFYGDSDNNQFFAGGGNETIDASPATGANMFVAGSGHTEFDVNPLAAASFYFNTAHDGGSDTIMGLGTLDTLNLQGARLASSTALSFGTMLTLSDGTQIWLQGYSGPVNITSSAS